MPEKPKPTPTTRARTVLTDPRLWSWVLGLSLFSLVTLVMNGDPAKTAAFTIYAIAGSAITVKAMHFR